VRFASVYRRFEDVAEFQDLLQEIRSGTQRPVRKRQDKNGVS
jgi:transcriptional regulator NrdR family protein